MSNCYNGYMVNNNIRYCCCRSEKDVLEMNRYQQYISSVNLDLHKSLLSDLDLSSIIHQAEGRGIYFVPNSFNPPLSPSLHII